MAYQVFSGNQRTNPRWLADFQARDMMAIFPARLDRSAFANYYGVDILLTADVAANATALPVTALAPPAPSVVPLSSLGSLIIPQHSVISFVTSGVDGGKKWARTTADVFLGATSIPVLPIPTALVAATDTAKWSRFDSIHVPSGLLVGRSFASRDSGTGLFIPSAAGADDEMYLTLYDVDDINHNDYVELLRPHAGVNVKINYLPGYSTLAAGVVTAINSLYNTIKGVN